MPSSDSRPLRLTAESMIAPAGFSTSGERESYAAAALNGVRVADQPPAPAGGFATQQPPAPAGGFAGGQTRQPPAPAGGFAGGNDEEDEATPPPPAGGHAGGNNGNGGGTQQPPRPPAGSGGSGQDDEETQQPPPAGGDAGGDDGGGGGTQQPPRPPAGSGGSGQDDEETQQPPPASGDAGGDDDDDDDGGAQPPRPPASGGGGGGTGDDDGPVSSGHDVVAEGKVTVLSGRVTTFSTPADDVTDVRIVDAPSHGTLAVNPDLTMALVLTASDARGADGFVYEATHADGRVTTHSVTLNLEAGPQKEGWGLGENHYMLPVDENGDVIVEAGSDHRPVYVSGSADALTLSDIARIEGLSVSEINGDWLAANTKYGGSEDMALAEDAGAELWFTVTGGRAGPNSNSLLLECGYDYDGMGQVVSRGTVGESELHPVHITSWGVGERPNITTNVRLYQTANENIVFSDLTISDGLLLSSGGNVIFDDVKFTGNEVIVQKVDGITFHNSEFVDIYREEQRDGKSYWDPGTNKIQGLFTKGVDGLLVQGTLFDYNSWREGYREDLKGGDAQPPSMFSHNVYITNDTFDVTFRDNVSMRAASFGAQFRGGAYIEDNLFLDNNMMFNVLGGDYKGAGPIGNYSFLHNNVMTSGAHKEAVANPGLTGGIQDEGRLTSFVGNIIAHLANPDDPKEQAERTTTHYALKQTQTPWYDDTIFYNWKGLTGWNTIPANADTNVDGLSPAVLDRITIQNLAADLTGKPNATIADFADYLRDQAEGALDDVVDAELAVRFFQEGFGIASEERTAPTKLTFVPSDLADGMRWDNLVNWVSDQDKKGLPGTNSRDTVDLNGNHVQYGGTATIADLDFGPGGQLAASHGRLNVDGTTYVDAGGSALSIDGAGQIWLSDTGGRGLLDISLEDGRFASTGDFRAQSKLVISGGEAILASDNASYGVTAGSRLEIRGDTAKVGFDGSKGGMAILGFDAAATLSYKATGGKLGTIEEFRSGAFGEKPNVRSGVDLGDAELKLDLSALAGTADHFLLKADELIGTFDGADVTGLGARDAEVVIDYRDDTVTLALSSGTGKVKIVTEGNETDVSAGDKGLWDALDDGSGSYDAVFWDHLA